MKKVLCPTLWLLLTVHLFAQPRITSFSPTNGPIGSTVAISGFNFDPIAAQNIVYFGAVRAVVSVATSTSLTVIVPPGATYQPITITTNNLTASSNLPFNVTFNGSIGPFTSNTFLPKNNITLGKNPFAVASGDFDGDGKIDLLIPLGNSDTISILRNTSSAGNITFSAPLNIKTTGTDNDECAIGDLDGDGKLDFVVTNGIGSNSFSVFQNTSTIGNISFAAKADFPATSVPTYISISDLNGDGKPDIALANAGSSTISTYINTSTAGSISFNPKVDFVTNTSLNHISIGDLDIDGKPDLVITANSVLSVMRNTSNGGNLSFAASMNLASINTSRFTSITDLDGDGKPEIEATNRDSVAILRNLSTPGNIAFGSPKSFPVGSSPLCIAGGDINGDGKPDLVVSNQSSNNVSALRNTSTTGNISFDTHIDYSTDKNPFSISIADLDQDQKPDIVSANSDVFTISILKNAITTGPVPAISSFTPTSGIMGTQVTIKGSNFINVTAVDFGGVAASSFTVDSATGITAIVANGATGVVRVTNNFGIATLAGFTYNGPVVNSITPSNGLIGTIVKIKGTNLTGVTTVTFGGAPASSFTVDSSTGITATVGAGLSGAVTVTSPGGTASLPGFVYNLPTITSFTPASGPVGTSITILGSHFNPAPANNIVYFGAVKATVSGGTDSTLIVKVPVGATYQPISVTANKITGYSNKPFNITFTGGGHLFTSSPFLAKLDVTTGTYPHSVASGDFDGDGKVDLLVSKGSDSIITILKNTSVPGSISFAPKQSFPGTGNSHENCAIGDIDGDGKLDFVIVNGTSSSTVSVFRNTSTVGNISFAAKINYLTGSKPYSVAIGDLSGDGRPEIIVTNNGSDSISVFRNVSTPGNISFDAKTSFYSGTNPFGVTVGDLDGDGKPDLAVTSQGSNSSLSVMRNTSTGDNISFAPKIDLAVLNNPFVVSIGDLDGDGKLDLAAASSNSNTVTVIRNASTPGNIAFKSRTELAVGNYPVSVSISDLDGDGKVDLATTNRSSNDISVIKSESTIGSFLFDNHLDYPVNAAPLQIAAADVDGDGRPDLIAANSGSDVISILQNIIGANVAGIIRSFTPTYGVSGTVVKISGTNFTGASSVSFGGVPATSFTVDSSTGITAVVGQGATGDVRLTIPYGIATLAGFVYGTPPTITSFSPDSGPVGTTVTISGSHFDPVASNNTVYFGAVRAIVSSGTDSSLVVTVPIGTTYDPITVMTKTLVAYSSKPFNVTFIGGDSSFTSNSFVPQTNPVSGDYPHSVGSGDFDGDGKPDLLVSRGSSVSVAVFKNISSPGTISFAPKLDLPVAPFRESEGCAVGDFDGDGKLDFAIANTFAYTVSLYRNTTTTGNISFAPKIDYPAKIYPSTVTIGDLNGDGKPELIVANDGDSVISIYKNLSTPGNLLFDRRIDLFTGHASWNVFINDLDGDGRPDLAIAMQGSSSTICIMRNKGIGGNISFEPKIDLSLQVYFNVAVGDIDGDGKPDLVATGYSTVNVLKNLTSIGNIAFGTPQSFPVGTINECVSIGDLNGDGKPDLVTSNWGDNTVSVLINHSNTGSIAFNDQVTYAVGANPNFVGIVDFDGDGRPDLAVANTSEDFVTILRNANNLVTGIINLGNDQYIKIYPNPVKNNLSLYWDITNTTSLNIIITNLQGRQVLAKQNVHNAEAIDLNIFPAGIYFLKILSKDQRINYTTKIIKQ